MSASPRRPPWKKLVRSLALSLVVSVVGGGGILAVISWLSGDMRAVTHEFLGHARRTEYAQAYQLASAELRTSVPPAAFPSYVQTRLPSLRGTDGEWINGFSGGGDSQCMDVWVTSPGSFLSYSHVYVLLQKEGGVWRVDGATEVQPDECDSDD